MKNVLALVLLVVCACGSDGGITPSGLDRKQKLNTLDSAQKGSLCDWVVEETAGINKQCGENVTVESQTREECLSDLPSAENTCDATVGHYEDCMGQLKSDPCKAFTNDACIEVISCAFGQKFGK